jgi:hypothetical protein
MRGCFSASALKVEKQRSSSVPRSGPLRSVVASGGSLNLLSNKPVELPDPRSIAKQAEKEHRDVAAGRLLEPDRKSRTQILKGVEKGRTAFSGPISARASSRVLPNYESSYEAPNSNSGGARTLRRTSSFGGRPQPLPLPVAEDATLSPATAKREVGSAPADAGRRSRRVRSFALEHEPGSRRGRVAPVGGLPLPPPSLAGKSHPSLSAQEFADLVAARGAFGDSHRVRDSSHGVAVFRLPGNAAQVL